MIFEKHWVEITMLVMVAAGFLFAITAKTASAIYFLALLSGILFGRLWYYARLKPKVPVLIIAAGFVVGYLIGTLYGDRTAVLTVFVLGMFIGYYLHEKRL